MRNLLLIVILAVLMLPSSALASTPIKGNISVQVAKRAQYRPEKNKPSLFGGLFSLFDSSGTLKTEEVATSVAHYFLAQDVPKSSILILTPETENKATEQFKAYLSATLLHAGYGIGQPTAADLPQSRFVPLAVYPYEGGVIIKLVVGKTQMTRFYALAASGKIQSASAYLVTQAKGGSQ